MSKYACEVEPNEYDAYDCAYCNNFECDSHKKCFNMFYGEVINPVVDDIKNNGLNVTDNELLVFVGYYELVENIKFTRNVKRGIKRFKTLIHNIEVDNKLSDKVKPYVIKMCNNTFYSYIKYRSDKYRNLVEDLEKIIGYNIIEVGEIMKINSGDLKIVVDYIIKSSNYKYKTFNNKTEGIKLFKTLIHDIEVDDRFSDEEIKKHCIRYCNKAFDVVGE